MRGAGELREKSPGGRVVERVELEEVEERRDEVKIVVRGGKKAEALRGRVSSAL